MPEVRIEAGKQTEELIQFILDELGETADEVDIERQHAAAHGLASEPITTSFVIGGLGFAGIVALGRIIEKWMENRREQEAMKFTLIGFSKSESAGNALAEIAKKHADIAVEQGLPSVPSNPWPQGNAESE
ncbi:MAG TPA: hypothetical protein VF541_21165 [Longimicrobium sp.]|jgi:hypothetical protein